MSEFIHKSTGYRSSWQQELGQSFVNAESLMVHLELEKILAAPKQTLMFPLRVTRAFASRMEKANINDPLLRQVLPLNEELTVAPGFTDNPVGDLEAAAVPGVLHKYSGRALLITTGHCAINCRYCFRKNFPYSNHSVNPGKLAVALRYIESQPDIFEIILSGGDPLVLSNGKILELISQIEAIPHISRLRIHSRVPVVLPSRIDSELLTGLSLSRLKPVIVVHINHPNEIDQSVVDKISLIRSYFIPVFNQAVLLKGVNDSVETLTELFEKAFDSGIFPYYLHMLDKSTGNTHFEVTEKYCNELQENLRKNTPGYLLPRFVREQADLPYKLPI